MPTGVYKRNKGLKKPRFKPTPEAKAARIAKLKETLAVKKAMKNHQPSSNSMELKTLKVGLMALELLAEMMEKK